MFHPHDTAGRSANIGRHAWVRFSRAERRIVVVIGVLVGGLVALGLVLIASSRRSPSLGDLLGGHIELGPAASADGSVDGGGVWPLARPVELLRSAEVRRRDLDVLERPEKQWRRRCEAFVLAAGALSAALASARFGAPFPAVLLAGIGGGLGGIGVADAELAADARAARADLDRAALFVSEVVAVMTMGGLGATAAVAEALDLSDVDSVNRIRRAVSAATLSGLNPWDGLAQLGQDSGARGVLDLGTTLGLAVSSGAALGGTLSVRARAARSAALDDELEAAEARTSRLGVPVGLLTFSWVAFLGYPALQNLVVAT